MSGMPKGGNGFVVANRVGQGIGIDENAPEDSAVAQENGEPRFPVFRLCDSRLSCRHQVRFGTICGRAHCRRCPPWPTCPSVRLGHGAHRTLLPMAQCSRQRFISEPTFGHPGAVPGSCRAHPAVVAGRIGVCRRGGAPASAERPRAAIASAAIGASPPETEHGIRREGDIQRERACAVFLWGP
jgi:hypothetical protein